MKTTGSILAGMGISLACQLLIVISLVLWMAIANDITAYFLVLRSGGLQWIVVVPLVLRWRSQGKSATIKGASILSFLGLLLNALFLGFLSVRNAGSTGPLF